MERGEHNTVLGSWGRGRQRPEGNTQTRTTGCVCVCVCVCDGLLWFHVRFRWMQTQAQFWQVGVMILIQVNNKTLIIKVSLSNVWSFLQFTR